VPVAIVIGGDCGGTATRVVAATTDGRLVGRGRGGPGNPVARPPAETAAALVAAAGAALDGRDPAGVVAAVAGVAGFSGLAEPEVEAAYGNAWRAAGFRCPLWTVGDPVVAYAAGSAVPTGTVLIAGTGAIACEIAGWAVGRRSDGLGWLLGDEGSGFWFGRAAARATADALHGAAEPGALTAAVRDAVGGAAADEFVSRFYALARDRDRVAALAPLVFAAARAGDPAARALVDDGAARLAATLGALHPAPGPAVLAGGLLVGVPELRDAVRARLATTAAVAGDAAGAAAWLAVGRHAGRERPELHPALTA
jgi:glucosamine kinase